MGRPIRSTCVSCDFQQSGCALHGPPTSGSQSLDTRVMPVSAACDPEVAGGNAAIESPWPEPSRTIWPPGPGRNSPWGLSASGVRVSRGLPRSKAASGHWPTSRWRAPVLSAAPAAKVQEEHGTLPVDGRPESLHDPRTRPDAAWLQQLTPAPRLPGEQSSSGPSSGPSSGTGTGATKSGRAEAVSSNHGWQLGR